MKMLSGGLFEELQPWLVRSEEILDTWQASPWGPFDRMAIDNASHSRPLNRDRALRRLNRARRRTSVDFIRGGVSITSDCPSMSVLRGGEVNSVTFCLPEEDVRPTGTEAVIGILRETALLLPRLCYGRVDGHWSDPDFSPDLCDAHGLNVLPPCFRYVEWCNVVHPRMYHFYYDREQLLEAPAHRVEEWDDGTIMIMAYEDPFAYETDEAKARVLELQSYLYERAKSFNGPHVLDPEWGKHDGTPDWAKQRTGTATSG